MAITYDIVRPHLRRAQALRARRMELWSRLHEHDGRDAFWRIVIPSVL